MKYILTWCPCGCICEKACSGRESTVKGLDITARLAGEVEGELECPPPCELLLTETLAAVKVKKIHMIEKK